MAGVTIDNFHIAYRFLRPNQLNNSNTSTVITAVLF
nr:MAG TPA: hypothetical protein [Caudoviricetes sp.]